jgi:hypothetical protein
VSDWADGLERDADGNLKPFVLSTEWVPPTEYETAVREVSAEWAKDQQGRVLVGIRCPRCDPQVIVAKVHRTRQGALYAADVPASPELRAIGIEWSAGNTRVPSAFRLHSPIDGSPPGWRVVDVWRGAVLATAR